MAARGPGAAGDVADRPPPSAPGSFLMNSLALVSGTVLSQAIVFVFSPLLSRLFNPAEFGHLASYNAWVALLTLLGSLRYEHAIIITPNRTRTSRVLALTLVLSLVSALLFLVLAAVVFRFFSAGGYAAEIRGFILLIPLGVLLASITSPLIQYHIKIGRFRRLAALAALQVILTVVVQSILGYYDVEYGLILGTLAGFLVAATAFAVPFLRDYSPRELIRQAALSRLRATARRYIKFPRYTLAADAVGVAMQQFIPVVVLAFFNPTLAGLYAFSMRVVRVPLIVVSSAVAGSLRKEAVDRLHGKGELARLVAMTTRNLFLLSLAPFLVIVLFGREIFGLVFGEQWLPAGALVQILSPGIMLEFIAFPLSVIFLVTNSQQYTFRIQAVGFLALLAALAIGRYYFDDFLATCYLISAVMVAVNGVTIALAGRVSRAHVTPVPA
jgi:O-antigen/teichoic acid export membrane protein